MLFIKMLRWTCLLVLLFKGRCTLTYDSASDLGHRIDKAALDLLQTYDEDRIAMESENRLSLQKDKVLFRAILPLQDLEACNPVDIAATSIKSRKGVTQPVMAIANQSGSRIKPNSTVDLFKYDMGTKKFEKIYSIPEVSPYILNFFTVKKIDDTEMTFLAIASDTEQIESAHLVIYEIKHEAGNITAKKFQDIESVNVDAVKSFTRNNESYLIIGVRLDTQTVKGYPARVLVLRYNKRANYFEFHSSLSASFISDIEIIETHDMLLMFVAYNKDREGNIGLKSPVYWFDDKEEKFSVLQTIPTKGSSDVESFSTSHEHYMIIVNTGDEVPDVVSAAYKWTDGGFHPIDDFSIPGAMKWRSVVVPNCKETVLLSYIDQQYSEDLVGFFTYTNYGDFEKLPLPLYESEFDLFRPIPETIATFSIEEELFIVAAARNNANGYTIYKIEYEKNSKATPAQHIADEISYEISQLQSNLTSLVNSVTNLEQIILKFDLAQYIHGPKVFRGSFKAERLIIKKLESVSGNFVINQNGTLASPNKFQEEFTYIESTISNINTQIEEIELAIEKAPKIVGNISLQSDINFSTIKFSPNDPTLQELHISNCKVDSVDVCRLKEDLVFNETNDNITGAKTFSSSVTFSRNLHLTRKLNNVVVTEDLVHSSRDQVITSKKIFEKGIDFPSATLKGKFNGIALENDTISLQQEEVIFGNKRFNSNIEASVVDVLGTIDKVNVTGLKEDTLDIQSKQNISGKKVFMNGSRVYNHIKVSGLTNMLNLDEWSRKLVDFRTRRKTIDGSIVFLADIHIKGNLSVEGKMSIDNLIFPDNFVLIRGKQEITGKKVFASEIIVKGNLKVNGLVDNVNISETVRISNTDEISGKKTFANDLKLLNHVNVSKNSLVNGIDLSELSKEIITMDTLQRITGKTIMANATLQAQNCLQVNGNFDGKPLGYYVQLFNNAMKQGMKQTITAQQLLTNVTVKHNLTIHGTVNGYKLPCSFLVNFNHQVISVSSVLQNIKFQRKVRFSSKVNGQNLDQFGKDLIRIDSNSVISGSKTFIDDVIVDGNIEPWGAIGKLPLDNILKKTTVQVVSASKSFKNVKSRKLLRVSAENVTVGSTVDGVDLSEFKGKTVYRKNNKIIHTSTKFSRVIIDKRLTTGRINGISLKALEKDLVTINTNQIIPSNKTFEGFFVQAGILTNSSIDDIDVAQLSSNIVRTNESARISGSKTFRHIIANSVEISGLVHGVNLSKISEDAVMRTKDTVIVGSKFINGQVSMRRNLRATTVNALRVPTDIVLKSIKQQIAGKKQFVGSLRVNGNVQVARMVNNVDISSLYHQAVLKSKEQHISGKKIILNSLESKDAVNVSRTVNGVDLLNLNKTSVKTTGHIVVRGAKKFLASVKLKGSIRIKGFTNNKDWSSITNDAVLRHHSQSITGHSIFEHKLFVLHDVVVGIGGVTTGLINHVNISLLDRSTLKTHSRQVITGKKQLNMNTIIRNGITTSSICGKKTKDYVTIEGSQIIKGRKVFMGIHAVNDVTVTGTTDGVKLAEIAADTFSVSKPQTVNGVKSFINLIRLKSNMISRGQIDFKVINPEKVIIIDSDQRIERQAVFHNGMVATSATVHGVLCGLNISETNIKRVTLNTKQQILGPVVIANHVHVRDVTVHGTINGVDLSQWQSSLHSVLKTTKAKCHRLSNISRSYCPAFKYLKNNFGRDSQIYIDFNQMKQSFNYDINHIAALEIGNSHYIAIVRAHKAQDNCAATEIMLLDHKSEQYILHQRLSHAVDSRFMAFDYNQEVFLFLENAEKGCMLKGQSILYKWNFNTSLFEIFQYIETRTVRHSNFMRNGTSMFLAIAHKELNLVEVLVWTRGQSKFNRLQIISSLSPVAIEFFMIDSKAFMAVANDYDPLLQSFKTQSVIYELNSKRQKWERLQGIPTDRACDVKYFRDNKHHYVAFTSGNVDVYQYSNRTGLFTYDHSINAPSPIEMQIIPLQNVIFLVVVSKGIGLFVYRQRLHFEYEVVAVIPHTSVTHVTAFIVGNGPYLAIGSRSNMDCNGFLGEYCPRILEGNVSGMHFHDYDAC